MDASANRLAMRKLSPLLGAAAMVTAMAASTPALPVSPDFEPDREIMLVCTATGADKVNPETTAELVCAAFKRGLDAGLAQVTRTGAVQPRSGNVIRVELTIADNRSASAMVTTIARGKSTDWPEFAVDVMDRSLEIGEIELLAREVARTIDQRD